MAELVTITLEAAHALPLQSLEEDWVKECWNNHFLDLTPLPLATEDLLQSEGFYIEQLEKLHDVAKKWHHSQSDTEGLWTSLLVNDVSHKALVALLAHLMPMEHNSKAYHGQKKEAAFVAATVYLNLVSLPGSRAFKVYSPDLLLRAVNMLKVNTSFGQSGTKKRGTQAFTSSQKSQSNKRSRRNTQNTCSSQNSSNDIEGDDSDDIENEDDLAPSQVQRFHSLYMNLLTEVVTLLSSFSLRESQSVIEQVIKVLAVLTRVDNHSFDGRFPLAGATRRSGYSPGVTALAFKGILHMCQPLHGDITALTTSTCKYLLPNVLMLLEGKKVCATQTIPQQLQLGRQHATAFVMFMMKELGEPCLISVKILLQHMCMRVPDKADYRTKAAQGVVAVLEQFPDSQYAFMLKWIGVLSRNEKVTVRAFSLDLLTLLLSQPERQLHGVSEEEKAFASHAVLINQLLARCSDVAAVVRTRAITGFAQCLGSGEVSVKTKIKAMITPRNTATNQPRLDPTPAEAMRTVGQADRTGNETEDQGSISRPAENPKEGEGTPSDNNVTPVIPAQVSPLDKPQTPFQSVEVMEALNNSLPDRHGMLSMLHRRAREDKVYVRKAALHALHMFILFEAPDVRKEDMDVLCERCRDKALSVRKQALTSLTEVLLQCQNDSVVQSAWLKGVFAMVWDQETSVQEKCLETVESILLCHIVPYHRSKGQDHTMAWQLLTLISKTENSDLRRHFKKMCRMWEREKKLKSSLITSILSHVGTHNNQAAWSVLADMGTTKINMDVRPVLQFWTDHSHTITGSTDGEIWENILQIIGFNVQAFSHDQRSKLTDEFKSYLLRFDMKPVLVSSFATAIHQLSQVNCEDDFRSRQEWGREVLAACDHYLSAVVLDEDMSGDVSFDEDKMMCHLYTLGVVALLCPSITPKRAPMLVQSFIASPCISAAGDSSDNLSSGSQPLVTSHGSEANEEGSQGTQGSQSTQGSQNTQGSQSTQPLSQFRGCKMSDRVRAVAFLTLGKLCLQDKQVAKKCVPAMARELEVSPSDSVRNNIIIILRDLCVRYTTLVDPHVSSMAACLRDPAPIVRRQTLELLTGLLQEDYLKWKGSLFYRFALTLLDPHPDIAAFGEFCLGFHLLKRHPTLMSQHLLESIFVFNDYDKHNVFNKYTQTERERELFSLKGKENQSQRFKLYQFMLDHMEDAHRFQLTSKISQEVLGAMVDGLLPYDEDSCDLLQDALHILSSKEIKLSSLRSTKTVEYADDEMEMANAVIATAKKTLITQVVKKNVMENVIPVVLSLKHMLDKERSPLLLDLMAFLRELMTDYKNEVKDVLAADKQLACEVEYDLRMFEKQQAPTAEQGQNDAAEWTTPVCPPVGEEGTPRARPSSPAPRPSTSGRKGANTPAVSNDGKNGATAQEGGRPSVSGGTPQPQSSSNGDSATRQAALRTVERLKEKRQSSGRADGRRLSSVKWAENVIASTSSVSESDQENGDKDKPQTPQRPRRPLRAISTPSGLLSNVTFAEENNLTLPMEPPSPIPGYSKSQANVTGEEENEDIQIVFTELLGSQGQAKPREWNVKLKTEKQLEEASQPAVLTSPVVRRSRRSRHLQSS